MQPDFIISSVTAETQNGAIGSLTVVYSNGLVFARGRVQSRYSQKTLDDLGIKKRIIAGTIETGILEGGSVET